MPKQKDLKRLTRARMDKTGESYTAARAILLAKKRGAPDDNARQQPPEPAQPAAAASPPAEPVDYAALAGMNDETILAKTGRDWQRWVESWTPGARRRCRTARSPRTSARPTGSPAGGRSR